MNKIPLNSPGKRQRGRTKSIVFGTILVLLVGVAIEAPFRVVDYIKECKFQKAQTELAVMSDEELGPLDDRGWRIIDSFDDLELLKKAISDIKRLNGGGIAEYLGYRKLAPRKPYFTFRVNNMGFRGPDWERHKGPDEVRVFIVGASAPFSFFSDEEHSIHQQLEYILNRTKENKNKRYRVYSAAVPGNNSSHDLEIVRKFIVAFHPDIVVAINGFSDASGNSLDPDSDGKSKGIVDNIYHGLASLSSNLRIGYSYAVRFLVDRLSAWGYYKIRSQEEAGPSTGQKGTTAKVYLSNMIKMREFLAAQGAKLLVYLQPNLLVSGGKPLTEPERYVRSVWALGMDSYDRHCKFYPLMLNYLKDTSLDYINGQDLGKYGLRSGRVGPHSEFPLKEEQAGSAKVVAVNIFADELGPNIDGEITLLHQDGQKKISILPKMLWGNSELKLEHTGATVIKCEVIGGPALLKHGLSSNSLVLGYQNVAYSAKKEDILFQFSSPTPIQYMQWTIFLSNYKDRDDVRVKVSASSDGINYEPLSSKDIPFGLRKEARWHWTLSKPDRYSVFLKMSFSRMNNYIGLDGINVAIKGEQRDSFWAPDDPLVKIVNGTGVSFDVESFHRIGGEGLFADAAHLNFKANAMLAKQIAEYILDKDWSKR